MGGEKRRAVAGRRVRNRGKEGKAWKLGIKSPRFHAFKYCGAKSRVRDERNRGGSQDLYQKIVNICTRIIFKEDTDSVSSLCLQDNGYARQKRKVREGKKR